MKKVFIILAVLIFGCKPETKQVAKEENSISQNVLKSEYEIIVKELTDDDYPDNPDIGYRSEFYQQFSHKNCKIIVVNDSIVSFEFPSTDSSGAIIKLENLDILTWMPAVPKQVQNDEYLAHICMINQEWNRQQVKFTLDDEQLKIEEGEKENGIVRVDLARNCLNSGLWEIAAWREEGGGQKIYYHGWFDFPLDLYADLVNKKSGIDFKKYQSSCVDWKDPESKVIELEKLRTIISRDNVDFKDLQNNFYPKKKARLKKYKNIVCPKNTNTISQFLNDSTTFSTFSQPGWYNTKDPRKTELGRFTKLKEVEINHVKSLIASESDLLEINMNFTDNAEVRKTKLVFGGIKKRQIPTLAFDEMNDGFKMPMGIANHSFYETYKQAINLNYRKNSYYGFVLDDENKWLDSHFIGIDGPLLHWDDKEEGVLHLWLLSFERHAFVGHYKLYLNGSDHP